MMEQQVMKKSRKNVTEEHLITFIPPTIPQCFHDNEDFLTIHDSYTYLSPIPSEIQIIDPTEEIILGIDEAGRGPVLGPMVYSVAYCLKKNLPILKENEFDDSKKLTEVKRTELLYAITRDDENVLEFQKSLKKNIGYCLTSLSAQDISSEMLNSLKFNNLNNQAHETTIDLISKTLEVLKDYNVTEVYIDTVGPPSTYQEKLSKIFPQLKITVSKKADSIYPIVSAASVVAKVTRDILVEKYNKFESGNEEFGSGYPSDPKTTRYLQGKVNPIFGWGQIVRYSWATAKTLLKNKGTEVVWEDEIKAKKIEYGNSVSNYFTKKNVGENDLENLEVSTFWYSDNVIAL